MGGGHEYNLTLGTLSVTSNSLAETAEENVISQLGSIASRMGPYPKPPAWALAKAMANPRMIVEVVNMMNNNKKNVRVKSRLVAFHFYRRQAQPVLAAAFFARVTPSAFARSAPIYLCFDVGTEDHVVAS